MGLGVGLLTVSGTLDQQVWPLVDPHVQALVGQRVQALVNPQVWAC